MKGENNMALLDFAIRLGLAFILGAAIGFERQWHQRMAGLRTNTLVATGSALFVMMSVMVTNDSSPTRMASQVVSGIGFLGAGVIMRDGLNIHGLNTAATLWCSAAIGTLCGAGFSTESVTGAAVILFANTVLRPLAQKVNRTANSAIEGEIHYCIEVVCRTENEAYLRTLLLHIISEETLTLCSLHSKKLGDNTNVSVEAQLISAGRTDTAVEKIVSRFSFEPAVSAVSWEIAPLAVA